MAAPEALVVAPEALPRSALARRLSRLGPRVCEASSATAAREALASREFDVVVATLRQRDGSGFDVLASAAQLQPDAAVVLLAANAPGSFVRDGMRLGAFACLAAPLDADALDSSLRHAAEIARLRKDIRRLRRLRAGGPGADALLGVSRAARALRGAVRIAARGGGAVLLVGEAGTGKRTAARAIHEESGRPGPFVEARCAPDSSVRFDADLFGREGGDATDGAEFLPGLVEAAHGGTLYLEHADHLSPDAQERLLAVLAGCRLRRPCGVGWTTVDVRVVAGVERDLRVPAASRRLREDLLAVLCAGEVRLVPLRDRRADVPVLARHFARRASARRDRPALRLSAEAEDALSAWRWPGNVRELRLAVDLAVSRADGALVRAGDLACSWCMQETNPSPARRAGTLEDPSCEWHS